MADTNDTQTLEEKYEMLVNVYEKSEQERHERNAKLEKERIESQLKNANFEEKQKIINQELNKQLAGIGLSVGKITEALIYNSLEKDMTLGGIDFQHIEKNKSKYRKDIDLRGEFDIVLTNTDTIAIIETKSHVDRDDVTELIDKKLNNFRTLFPEYAKYKIIFGIGGMSFDNRAITEANKNGIGLIKVSADKVEFHTDKIKEY